MTICKIVAISIIALLLENNSFALNGYVEDSYKYNKVANRGNFDEIITAVTGNFTNPRNFEHFYRNPAIIDKSIVSDSEPDLSSYLSGTTMSVTNNTSSVSCQGTQYTITWTYSHGSGEPVGYAQYSTDNINWYNCGSSPFSIDYNPATSGTYNYYGRMLGNYGVVQLSTSTTVTVSPTPSAPTNVTATPSTICNGSSSTLSATATSGLNSVKALVLWADGSDAGLQAYLSSDTRFSSVGSWNATSSTPTLADLMNYNVVITWGNNAYADNVTLGNNLKSFVDAGGGVVVCTFGHDNAGTWGVNGAFLSNNYDPIQQLGAYASVTTSIGTVSNPSHSIMSGVSSVSPGYTYSTSTLSSGASPIFYWANGEIGCAIKTIGTGRTVGLNQQPNYDGGTHCDLLIANAVAWAGNYGGSSGTVNWYTVSSGGTPFASGNSTNVSPGATTTYYAEVQSGSTGYDNGAGGVFNYNVGDPPQTIALKACESKYGVSGCTTGACGLFSYYYSSASVQCDCSKPVGQYEWIYSNTGYTQVGQDYGGQSTDVTGDGLFVRVKGSATCDANSWILALKDLGTVTASGGVCSSTRVPVTVTVDNAAPTYNGYSNVSGYQYYDGTDYWVKGGNTLTIDIQHSDNVDVTTQYFTFCHDNCTPNGCGDAPNEIKSYNSEGAFVDWMANDSYLNITGTSVFAGGWSGTSITNRWSTTVSPSCPDWDWYPYTFLYDWCGYGNGYTALGKWIRVDNTAPTRDEITVNSSCWATDGTNTYTITIKSTEPRSGFGGPYGMMALVNYHLGDENLAGGYFAWHPTSYVFSANQMACSGGGYVSKYTGWGGGRIDLVSATTSVSGNQRTVVFTVRPHSDYIELDAVNKISMYTSDNCSNEAGWTLFNVNFSTMRVPATPTGAATICTGGSATLTTASTPPSGVTYYWQTSPTGTSQTIGSGVTLVASPGSTTTYYVRPQSSSGCWGQASAGVTVTVVADPGISISSGTTTICYGQTTSFTASATGGTGTMTYQWQYYSGSAWVNAGSNSSSYTSSALSITTIFRCLYSSTGTGCDAATSNSITINVQSQSITPANANASPSSICTGGSSSLSVVFPGILDGGLLNYNTWTVGSGGATGFSQNGGTAENERISGADPWGNTSVIWETRPSGNGNDDGGWNSDFVNVDNTKLYRVSVWVRRTSATSDGRFYLGTNGIPAEVRKVSDGSEAGNPYWDCPLTNTLDQNQWYLVVGHVFPYNYSGTTAHPESGYYTVASGKIRNYNECNVGPDVKFAATTAQLRHRTYHYYCGDNTTRLQFAYPRIDLVDGTEPSINQLLNGYDSRNGLGSGGTWNWYSTSCGTGAAGSGESISVSPLATTTYYLRAQGTCNTTPCASVSVPIETPASPTITPNGSTTFCTGSSIDLTAADNISGNALYFNATGQYVDVGNPTELQITGNQTIEMWVKPYDFAYRYNPYNKAYAGEGTITQEPGGSFNYFWGIDGNNGSQYQGFTSGSIPVNTWTHIAIVRDLSNNILTWYINGVVSTTAVPSYAAAVAGNNSVSIGKGYASAQGYNGLIDEVRVWNVARTQAQIQASMNTTVVPGTAGLAGYWRFNEGSGSVTSSMGSFHAANSLVGSPTFVSSGAPIQTTFSWSPSTGLNTTVGATVTASPTTSTTYQVTASSPNGCTSTNSIALTVNQNNTINLSSAIGTNAQTKCINTSITNITYSITGATGATITGLPTGVTGSYASNVVTISGTPTVSGTFPYTVTLTGGCGIVNENGTITVHPSLTAGAIATTGQTICNGGTPSVIGNTTSANGGDGTITYSWRSSADGYTAAISGATGSTYTPPVGLTTTTSYRRYAKDNSCNTTPIESTGTWTITVNQDPSAQTVMGTPVSGTNICTGAQVSATFSGGAGGAGSITDNYQYSLDGGSTWNAYTSGTNITSAATGTNFVQIRTWRSATGSGCDNSGYSTAQWNVNSDPSVTASGSTTICSGLTANLSASGSDGAGIMSYQWQYYNGGTWVNTGTNSNSHTTHALAGTTDFRCLYIGTGSGCETANSNTVTVTINNPIPTALTSGDYVWTGAVNTNWNNASNWVAYNGSNFTIPGAVPATSNDVLFTTYGTSCGITSPVISSATGNCNNLTIESGHTVVMSNSQTLNVQGNWTNDGTFTAGNGTVVFNGSSQQSILAGGNAFNNVTFSNSTAGTTDINISEPMTINGAATFTNGVVYFTGMGSLSFGSSATSSTGNVNSYVDGVVSKTGTSAFTFAVGAGPVWAPVSIAAPSPSSTITADYNFTEGPLNWSAAYMCDQSQMHHASGVEHWVLTTTSATPAVTLYWYDGTRSGISDLSDLTIAHYNGTCWEYMGGIITGNLSIGSITSTVGFSGYSPVSFGSKRGTNPLPIELTRFNAVCVNSGILLAWQTASETNNDYFAIERSVNSVDFETLVEIEGAGNSLATIDYSYYDNNPLKGISYYRLKQTDYDGTAKYSETIAVNCDGTISVEPEISTHPNPFDQELNIIGMNLPAEKTIVRIEDVLGKEIYLKEIVTTNGIFNLNVSTDDFPPAVYIIRINCGAFNQVVKVVKQ